MNLSREQLVAAYDFVAKRYGIQGVANESAIDRALAFQRELHPEPHEQPAALFYAFSRYPRCFPGAFRPMAALIAKNSARHHGFELRASAEELDRLLFAGTAQRASYEEIRDWFGRRLVPR